MRRIFLLTATCLLSAGMTQSATAQAIVATVDCDHGQKIATALQQGDFRKPLLVNVRGTCHEFVRLTRDNVTLHGDPSATLVAPDASTDLVYIGANGVTLENLVLSGGYYGIRVDGAFRTVVRNTSIRDSASHGVQAFVGDARFIACTVENAGGNGFNLARGASVAVSQNSKVQNNAGVGVYAEANSVVAVNNSRISGNGSNGVELRRDSEGTLTGSTISGNGANPGLDGNGVLAHESHVTVANGNAVTDNRAVGVLGVFATVGVYAATVARNEHGIGGYLHTSLDIIGANVRENRGEGVWCNGNCTAAIHGASINFNGGNGISILWGSKLMLVEPTTDATRNGGFGLQCGDAESSVFDTAWLNGPVSPSCTGF